MFDIFIDFWWQYLLLALCCYAFCNVNFAITFSKIFKKSDVRDYGSGNAGTTNMFRVYGLGMGALTFFCDTMKGVICCLLARLIFGWSTPQALTAGYVAGLFAVLGHVFPVVYRFRGGKGVATCMGVFFSLQPIFSLCLVVPYCVILLLSDRVSVASLIWSVFMIVWSWLVWGLKLDLGITYHSLDAFECLLVTVSFAVVIFAHRHNIARIFTGKEQPTGLRKALRGKSDTIVK